MKKRLFLLIFILSFSFPTFAWTWKDLWFTRDQQGMALMEKENFSLAQHTFKDPAWQATAAFRAKDYDAAYQTFAKLNTADGYYNQGNALAHLGKYQEALQAYNQSLILRPKDEDTLHNKKVIEALLKEQSQNKSNNSSSQNDSTETQQNQDSKNQSQDSSPEENSPEKPAEQTQQNTQDTQPKKQETEKTAQSQEQSSQDAQNQEENSLPEQETTQEQPPDNPKDGTQITKQDENLQQQEKQWLNMIPDDPGGLLKQKFLRDHLRREQGENL